jgi:hypothetical protein
MNQPQPPIDSPASSSDEQHVKSVFPFGIRDVVDQVWGDYLKAVNGELQSSGALTGFDDLDRMIGGLAPGLHLLASRPSMAVGSALTASAPATPSHRVASRRSTPNTARRGWARLCWAC